MPSQAPRFNTLRIGANLVTSISQIIVPILPALGYGSFVGQQSAAQDIPIVPAGYAFSIWSVIFLMSLIYAIYQALPAYQDNPLFKRIGWYTAGAFFTNTIWMLVAQFSTINWPTAIIICIILGFALRAMFLLNTHDRKKEGRAYLIVHIPVSMLAGWVSAATALNIASVLNIESITLGILIIIVTVLGASYIIIKTHGNLIYALAVIWALTGIIVRQLMETREFDILLIGIGSIVYLAAAAWYARRFQLMSLRHG